MRKAIIIAVCCLIPAAAWFAPKSVAADAGGISWFRTTQHNSGSNHGSGWPYASDAARSGDCCHCCFDEGTAKFKCYNMERSACERSRGRCVVKVLCK